MVKKLNNTKILAWIAFAIYGVSLLLPYASFDVKNGNLIYGWETPVLFSVLAFVPALVFLNLNHAVWTKLLAFICSSFTLVIGVGLVFVYFEIDRSYPLDLEIGMGLYFVAGLLLLIAAAIRFYIPVEDRVQGSNELIDSVHPSDL